MGETQLSDPLGLGLAFLYRQDEQELVVAPHEREGEREGLRRGERGGAVSRRDEHV